jgi:hypothetical protein
MKLARALYTKFDDQSDTIPYHITHVNLNSAQGFYLKDPYPPAGRRYDWSPGVVYVQLPTPDTSMGTSSGSFYRIPVARSDDAEELKRLYNELIEFVISDQQGLWTPSNHQSDWEVE